MQRNSPFRICPMSLMNQNWVGKLGALLDMRCCGLGPENRAPEEIFSDQVIVFLSQTQSINPNISKCSSLCRGLVHFPSSVPWRKFPLQMTIPATQGAKTILHWKYLIWGRDIWLHIMCDSTDDTVQIPPKAVTKSKRQKPVTLVSKEKPRGKSWCFSTMKTTNSTVTRPCQDQSFSLTGGR